MMGKVLHLGIVLPNSYYTLYRCDICSKMTILRHKLHQVFPRGLSDKHWRKKRWSSDNDLLQCFFKLQTVFSQISSHSRLDKSCTLALAKMVGKIEFNTSPLTTKVTHARTLLVQKSIHFFLQTCTCWVPNWSATVHHHCNQKETMTSINLREQTIQF